MAIPNVAMTPVNVAESIIMVEDDDDDVLLLPDKLHNMTPTVNNTNDMICIYFNCFRSTTYAIMAVQSNLVCTSTEKIAAFKFVKATYSNFI